MKTKEEIVEILKEKKNGATLKELAAKHGVGESTISNWQRNSKPKRKVKRAVKAKPTDSDWQKAFDEFIFQRDAANEALKKAETARKKLEQIVKELK